MTATSKTRQRLSKTLIAGASNFVGSALSQALWKAEREVAILAKDPSQARSHFQNIEIDYIKASISEPRSLHRALRGADTVISCLPAARSTPGGHAGEVRNLVEAARKAGVKHFIYLNLAQESWHSTNLAAEQAVIESGIPYTVFRPSWIFGRDDENLNAFVKLADSLPFVPVVGDGTNRVQPLFVMDFVKVLSAALDLPESRNQVYEIAGPETLSVDELAGTVLEVLGKRKRIVHHPRWFMRAATMPLRFLRRQHAAPSVVGIETPEGLIDNTKVARAFRFRLTPFRRALETYINPALGLP